jgi:N-acyl-D-aspartate/D-glutamate deacylase
MLDLKIVGGRIVDGTGRPGYIGDVGVKDGRITAVGECNEDAATVIDAQGHVVAPGFIDVHTHYDAQVFWDPKLSPSCYHGVTTVFGGFCGFSIAPVVPSETSYLQRMLSRVEGMPLDTLKAAVPWDWSSFADYLGKLEGNIGLNAGFFAGHSAIRRVVMGDRAVGEKASADEIEQMKQLLDKSLTEGAMGFSTTCSGTHNDYEGNPVPSRWADKEEFVALAEVVSRHEGTGLEMLPDPEFAPGTVELLADFSIAGNRPVNWNVLLVMGRDNEEPYVMGRLESADYARERGGEVIALTMPGPLESFLNLRSGFVWDSFPGVWGQMFKWPVDQRIEKFRDPAFRQQMLDDVATLPSDASLGQFANFGVFRVASARAPANKKYEGRNIGDIAKEEGKRPLDVMLDIAIEDRLETVFAPPMFGDAPEDFRLRSKLWADDRTLLGGSDAGAHLDMVDSFAFSTTFLQAGVREQKVISLEKAVQKITQRPARYFGLVDRGELKPGNFADIVVFDPDTVGRGPAYPRYDIPGGKDFRIYADATGIDHVFVNGVEIVRNGEHTGALPGTVLRSGQHTRTVEMTALREPA